MAQAQRKEAQRKQAPRDWPFDVKPLHPALGVEITGITLAQAVEPKMFDKVRHKNKMNIAFVDGHVALMEITQKELNKVYLLPN